jgi:hypothetical protein
MINTYSIGSLMLRLNASIACTVNRNRHAKFNQEKLIMRENFQLKYVYFKNIFYILNYISWRNIRS